MLLLVDNHDSFTYNLMQYLCELGSRVEVRLSDAIDVAEALALAPSRLVVSPGPGRPAAAGNSLELIAAFAGRVPVLGVCLGHQALAEVYGGRTVHAPELVHGKASPVHHAGRGLLAGLPSPFLAGRYHSLVVERASLPPELEVTAETESGLVMAIAHRSLPLHGVQFHPESILTPVGKRILASFLAL